ncbi:PREDICTED: uncharacterized protein LOC105562193 [Vollenhovia emeryi]|uniref:uncharacterized protein LOC105562193 n=1 Tax=Vollenhovia emeryi TaxID=411798 RepID=UPI0005F3F246|nr:PREDICTED: uncharacterized protein LOC105562193 [Vollenhovia emeryi]
MAGRKLRVYQIFLSSSVLFSDEAQLLIVRGRRLVETNVSVFHSKCAVQNAGFRVVIPRVIILFHSYAFLECKLYIHAGFIKCLIQLGKNLECTSKYSSVKNGLSSVCLDFYRRTSIRFTLLFIFVSYNLLSFSLTSYQPRVH